MTFSDEDIKKYQQLCRDYFNEEVNEATAIEEINSLMFLVNLIYHPQIKQRLNEIEHAEDEARAGQRKHLQRLSKDHEVD